MGTSLEHHRCFRIYIWKTRAIQICETVFFKHKCLTQPFVTPEDAVVTAAQQLTETLKGAVPGSHEELEALKRMGEQFKTIAANKAKEKSKEQKGNRIQLVPRVGESQVPRVEARKIVAYPTEAVVASKPMTRRPPPIIPNYSNVDIPAANTRLRKAKATRSVTLEAMIMACEMSIATIKASSLTGRRFPIQLLCEMAGAVMDASGEMLE